MRERFAAASAKRSFDAKDVAAGREYVEAYVAYIHYVEGVHEAARNPAHGHFPEGASAAHAE